MKLHRERRVRSHVPNIPGQKLNSAAAIGQGEKNVVLVDGISLGGEEGLLAGTMHHDHRSLEGMYHSGLCKALRGHVAVPNFQALQGIRQLFGKHRFRRPS